MSLLNWPEINVGAKNLLFEMEGNLQSVYTKIKDIWILILVFYGVEYSAKHQHSLLLPDIFNAHGDSASHFINHNSLPYIIQPSDLFLLSCCT